MTLTRGFPPKYIVEAYITVLLERENERSLDIDHDVFKAEGAADAYMLFNSVVVPMQAAVYPNDDETSVQRGIMLAFWLFQSYHEYFPKEREDALELIDAATKIVLTGYSYPAGVAQMFGDMAHHLDRPIVRQLFYALPIGYMEKTRTSGKRHARTMMEYFFATAFALLGTIESADMLNAQLGVK